MRRLVSLTAAVAALALTGHAAAVDAGPAVSPRVMHVGSTGPRVRALQWLLGGHRPSVYKIRAYRGPVTGRYDERTANAVKNTKYRLGWPRQKVNRTAGKLIVDVLEGKRSRPRSWIETATKRLALLHRIARDRATTACAKRVVATARGELGVHEIPLGSNDGPRVHVYQAQTGAFRAPWCVSFAQWVLARARVGSPTAWSGVIGDNSAGVFYVAGWARQHGWLRAAPKPAYLVAFMDGLGHMGVVESVTPTGFTSVEGNASDSVLERFHPFGARPEVFIRVPGCASG